MATIPFGTAGIVNPVQRYIFFSFDVFLGWESIDLRNFLFFGVFFLGMGLGLVDLVV